MKKNILNLLFVAVLVSSISFSCEKKEDDNNPSGSTTSTTATTSSTSTTATTFTTLTSSSTSTTTTTNSTSSTNVVSSPGTVPASNTVVIGKNSTTLIQEGCFAAYANGIYSLSVSADNGEEGDNYRSVTVSITSLSAITNGTYNLSLSLPSAAVVVEIDEVSYVTSTLNGKSITLSSTKETNTVSGTSITLVNDENTSDKIMLDLNLSCTAEDEIIIPIGQ